MRPPPEVDTRQAHRDWDDDVTRGEDEATARTDRADDAPCYCDIGGGHRRDHLCAQLAAQERADLRAAVIRAQHRAGAVAHIRWYDIGGA